MITLMVALSFDNIVYADNSVSGNGVDFSVSSNTSNESEDILVAEDATGTCGTNLTWRVSDYNTQLTISGTGTTMTDYTQGTAPWYSYRTTITRVVFSNCPNITHIGNYAFYNLSPKFSGLGIPASVTDIGTGAFMNCTNLGAATIPGTCKTIGERAFYGCTKIAAVNLREGTERIGREAFANGCYSSVTIPASVTEIGEGAFARIVNGRYENGNLTEVHYAGTVASYLAIRKGQNSIPSGAPIHCTDGVEGVTTPSNSPSLSKYELTAEQKAQIRAFVTRMYTEALGRAPDAEGLNDWCECLEKNRTDASGLARGFIMSPEMNNKNLSNADYVETLYKTFFGRGSDPEGKAGWVQALDQGVPRQQVMAGFVNSNEFTMLCDSFGVSRGIMNEDGSSVFNANVRNFVLRNYECILGRRGETAGVDAWSYAINMGQATPIDVSTSFFKSEEFLMRHTTNEAYVDILYGTFLGRTPDTKGKEEWVSQLNNGVSRDQILAGFAYSKEFAMIMADYGLQ